MFGSSRMAHNRPMGEVRLCWKSIPRIDGEVFECGPWKPEGSKDELLAILEAGNQVNGDGSHWIQERQVNELATKTFNTDRMRQ